ncbi:restriction endonuclease subunit S [Paraburkholderia strydomiana]|uniref:restriction endonuclease subunit S n=1 Tax=Paraburkholderia strydomiana TaxID=1245417 RepID=UPI0038BAD8F8
MNSESIAGWANAPLGQLATVVRGITFPATAKEAIPALDNVCCLRTSNIQKEVEWGGAYYVPTSYVKRNDQFVRPGDVLMSMANSYELVGKIAIVSEVVHPSAFGAFLAAIRPNSGVHGRYLYHLLRTSRVQSELREGSTQTTNIANISVSRLSEIDAPLPPLAEQKRIADKLDTVLARVDAVNDHLARVAVLLKSFRRSVLAAAISGKVTEEWRASSDSAKKWVPCTIGDLLLEKPRNGYSPKSVDYPTAVRSLTLTATTTGRFCKERFKYLDISIEPSSHLWLQAGDVLIQRANTLEYVGVSAIVTGNVTGFIYPDLMMKCRPNGRTTAKFLHLLLSSEPVRTYFRENATGTAGNMPKINQKTVMSARCSLPTPEEQAEIVRRVELLQTYADRLEARLLAAQTAAERLTPALLAKAFRGELVSQDPNDEPASELLRHLQANVSASKPQRGRRRFA